MAHKNSAPDRKIKILRIVSNLGIGGIQRQMLLQVDYIQRHHPEVQLDVCAFYRGGRLEKAFKEKTKVLVVNAPHKYSLKALLSLSRLFQNYDLIHIHKMEDIIPICSLAAAICGKKTVLHFHFTYGWPNRKKRLMEKLCCARAEKAAAVSHTVLTHISRKLFPYPHRFKCVYNGVKIREIKKEKSAIHRIGVISRLERFKNIDAFIEAVNRLREKRKDVKGLIAGAGSTEEELKRLSKDGIAFLGEKEKIDEILKKLDVGVLPSRKEGFSNTILEYMASQTPAVISNIPQNREAIPDGNTGYPVRIEELTEAISQAVERPASARKKALNAKRRACRFSIEKAVKGIYGRWIG